MDPLIFLLDRQTFGGDIRAISGVKYPGSILESDYATAAFYLRFRYCKDGFNCLVFPLRSIHEYPYRSFVRDRKKPLAMFYQGLVFCSTRRTSSMHKKL